MIGRRLCMRSGTLALYPPPACPPATSTKQPWSSACRRRGRKRYGGRFEAMKTENRSVRSCIVRAHCFRWRLSRLPAHTHVEFRGGKLPIAASRVVKASKSGRPEAGQPTKRWDIVYSALERHLGQGDARMRGSVGVA